MTPPPLLPDLDSFPERVYWLVRQIPAGEVATYGQIAYLAGATRAARACGAALKACVMAKESDLPWHRVINAQGGVSFKGDVVRAERQRERLTEEGIAFKAWRCDLSLYEWSPTQPYWSIQPLDGGV